MENQPPSTRILRLVAQGDQTGERVDELEKGFGEQLATSTDPEVILDLIHCNAMDSRAISVCVGVLRECELKGRTLTVEANPAMVKLFTMINLHRVMTIREVS